MDTVLGQPGSGWMIGIIAFIELASLLATALIVLMYQRARHRLADFFTAMDSDNASGIKQRELSAFPPLLWIYLLLTIAVTAATMMIFFFQPHWL